MNRTVMIRKWNHRYIVQGPPWQSGYFKLALTDKNMQVRFCLKVSVYSWGWGIWVSSTSFQKSNIYTYLQTKSNLHISICQSQFKISTLPGGTLYFGRCKDCECLFLERILLKAFVLKAKEDNFHNFFAQKSSLIFPPFVKLRGANITYTLHCVLHTLPKCFQPLE